VTRLPTVPELRARLRDPGFMTRAHRSGWEETNNPVYVWEAIAVCTEHKKPLPDWIVTYLAKVAQRMTSAETRAAKDVRKILPRIFGFPTKAGPGRPFDPDGGKPEDALSLAILFATELEQGVLKKSPNAAIRKAAATMGIPAFVKRNERTLLHWVQQAVGLERKPSTSAEWKAALRGHLGAIITSLQK
jgi:hypothetical protein